MRIHLRSSLSLNETREALRAELRAAHSHQERRAVRERARQVVIGAIVDDIVPRWLGTPWTMASSTERTCRTLAPREASSSISSKAILFNRLAWGATRGSVV